MLKNISAGFILGYKNIISKSQVSLREIFINFSVTMGGDGKSISKDQLNTYIDNAERGLVKVSDKKLEALKKIQNNWENCFKDKEAITYEDFEKNFGMFSSVIVADFTQEDIITIKEKEAEKKKKELNSFEELREKIDSQKEYIDKNDLQNYLKDLIEKQEDSEEIAFVTNVLADFDNLSSGDEKINSFKKIVEYSADTEISSEMLTNPIEFSV